VLVASAVGLVVFGHLLAEGFIQVMKNAFAFSRQDAFDTTRMAVYLVGSLIEMVPAILPFAILAFVVGFLGSSILGGVNFSTEALAPKFSKISPAKGLKRMFGVNALVELVKAIAKFLLVATVGYVVISYQFDKIMSLPWHSPDQAIEEVTTIIVWSALLIASSLLIVVAIDVPYQIWNHAKQLRMTQQEIKDEYKETEGNPQLKGRIRQTQREMAQRRMMSEVPTADVVITNPEHYAVALRYDSGGAGAPLVVAKGVDEIAMQIRKVALANEVPIIPAPPLARAIYYSTELEREIPRGLYVAVAQVLGYVFQVKQYKKGRGPKPRKPKKYDIPDELKHE
jgi:flagellar biosynthetic protein FlhB